MRAAGVGSKHTKVYYALYYFVESLFIASCHWVNMSEIILPQKSLCLQKNYSKFFEIFIHKFYGYCKQMVSNNGDGYCKQMVSNNFFQ